MKLFTRNEYLDSGTSFATRPSTNIDQVRVYTHFIGWAKQLNSLLRYAELDVSKSPVEHRVASSIVYFSGGGNYSAR